MLLFYPIKIESLILSLFNVLSTYILFFHLFTSVPLLTSDNTILGTLHIISLFIPYSIRKPCESRPPLMHMATVIDDIPLLKRAVDVENRGELWNFRVI